MAGDRVRGEHSDLRPDRVREDAERIPLGHRHPRPASRGPGASDGETELPGIGSGVKIVYVSPLKALSYDIERNLRAPLKGIGAELAVGLRTGDTPQRERQAMRRTPPDILITTPESLYLMITSQVREILTGVEAVIVDEIHAVAQSKRGSHLALTLERLSHLVTEEGGSDPQRIGLSATQRPLERIAGFLVGPKRECEIVNAGVRKDLDLEIVVPVDDMTNPSEGSSDSGRGPSGDGSADSLPDRSPERIDPGPIESSLDPGANPRSIWPAIYPELLELVREHTSTIIFVNNRRGAERLAKRLNELHNEQPHEELPATEHAGNGGGAGSREQGELSDPREATSDGPEEIARAHHGSLAHEERLVVEELLKSGKLPCLVATSSLELGIDMGALDLVIQVESPKSVSRGLQRIGRAGHQLNEVSKGRIFPKFRADLLECAVVAKRMRAGEIEETVIPRNPLDVLAQHLVSMVADSEWRVDEVERLVTATEPFSELSREQLENVLDMLDGRYPSEKFAELRPRLVWDRTAGTVRGRKGARQLAVTNAGTIPDRGLYGVHLPDGRRVGELDEEMVYEARPGQTFLLGATTWRIQEITRDRVIVVPAPGVPGAVPFWRGDGVGRPPELGRAIGAFAREAVTQGRGDARRRVRPRSARRREPRHLPSRAAGRDPRRAVRSDPGRRALPRRDRRLASLRPLAVRRTRACGLGARGLGADSRRARPRGGCDLVRRRDRRPPARRRRATRRERRHARARRGRGPGRPRARRLGAVRGPVPRERRPQPADSARLPRQAHAAVAATSAIAEPARGREGLPPLPGHPRDLPRVPARRPRPAGAGRPAPRPALAADQPGRGRDPDRLAVRLLAALRLRRHLHVRGRYAERGAPGGSARPRSRPALRAARRRRAARADRPGGARRGRALAAAAPSRRARQGPRRPAAGPAAARRPLARGVRGAHRRGLLGRLDAAEARARAARCDRPDRRGATVDRRRGRRALPRRRSASRLPPASRTAISRRCPTQA